MGTEGRLFLLVGPSGSGKDSLLRYARDRLSGMTPARPVLFSHRYITRPAAVGGENHIALSETEFALRLNAGLFALYWDGHGYRYGIGIEIDVWLARGLGVVVSGSRGAVDQALRRYPRLQLIWVQADPKVLRGRLLGRGRESAAAVERRLARAADYPPCESAALLDNSGPLEAGGEALLALLTAPS